MEDITKCYNSYLYRQLCQPTDKQALMKLNLKQTNNLRVGSDFTTIKYTGRGYHSIDVAVYSINT